MCRPPPSSSVHRSNIIQISLGFSSIPPPLSLLKTSRNSLCPAATLFCWISIIIFVEIEKISEGGPVSLVLLHHFPNNFKRRRTNRFQRKKLKNPKYDIPKGGGGGTCFDFLSSYPIFAEV